jgi:hypothetical protein
MGTTILLAAGVGFALLQIPTVGGYLGPPAYVAIMIAGIVRMRRRDKARDM